MLIVIKKVIFVDIHLILIQINLQSLKKTRHVILNNPPPPSTQNDKELYVSKQQLGGGVKQFKYAGLCQSFLKEFYLEIKLMP